MTSHYVVHGTVAWSTPWLTEQNLALALADSGARVLYVEPPISPLTPLKARSLPVARRMLSRRPRLERGVTIFQPLALPPLTGRRARWMSAPLVRAQLRRVAAAAGLRRPVVISMRMVVDLDRVVDERLRVYFVKDWIQAGPELLGRDSEEIVEEVFAMVDWADLVCVVSRQLGTGLKGMGIESELVQHGFHTDLAAVYDSAVPPADLRSLPRPWLGYAGRIDDRLDFAGLVNLADAFPEGTIALVGPVSPRLSPESWQRLHARPNIRLLGPRTREALPPYLSHFDCALLPYRRSDWSDYGSPVKLWEYLYAGPPIVGSGYVSLRDYPPPLVLFAERREEFVDLVREAIRPGEDGAPERRRCALDNSWAVRAERLEALTWDAPAEVATGGGS